MSDVKEHPSHLDGHSDTQSFSNVKIAKIRQVMKEAEMNLKVLVQVDSDTLDSLLDELQFPLLQKLKYPILQLTTNDNGDCNHVHVKEVNTENSDDIKTNIDTDTAQPDTGDQGQAALANNDPSIVALDHYKSNDELDIEAFKNIIKFTAYKNDEKTRKEKGIDDNEPTIFELTLLQASLSSVLKIQPSYADAIKIDISKYHKLIQISPLCVKLSVPKFICQLIAVYISRDKIPNISKVNKDTMQLVVKYLKHHNGQKPKEIAKPIRSTDMEEILDDKWDANFINSMNKKTIFLVILASDHLGINSLQHLACAKIAAIIKGTNPEELKRMLQAESHCNITTAHLGMNLYQ